MGIGLKIAAVVCLTLDAAGMIAVFAHGFTLLQGAAEAPNEATGQIVAIHNKTHILYVTQAQINQLYGLIALNFGLTIATVMIFAARTRTR